MTAAAAMCAIAAAAAGLLDEDRTNRKEHDSRYDQSQNYITNTHGKSLLSNTEGSVGVHAHAAQTLGGVSLGRLAEQQEDDQRDERDGNDRANTESQLAGDQTADLINDGGYNTCRCSSHA